MPPPRRAATLIRLFFMLRLANGFTINSACCFRGRRREAMVYMLINTMSSSLQRYMLRLRHMPYITYFIADAFMLRQLRARYYAIADMPPMPSYFAVI